MIRTPLALVLAVSAWFGVGAPQSMALTDVPTRSFNLFQGGYAENATITGSFSGADLDGNGLLIHFPLGALPPLEHLELTAFSVHFSGNSLSPAFDLTLDDLFGFIYELDSSHLGDGPAFDPTLNQDLLEGIGVIGEQHFYSSGLGPNGFIGGWVGGQVDFNDFGNLDEQAVDESASSVQVTPVPEPAGMTVMMALITVVLRAGRATGPFSRSGRA